MADRRVDVAIIGAGTAGMAAYREVSKRTDSVALIEGGSYGTTCAKVGCMPSKLLIAAAHAAHAGPHASPFGVHYDAPRVDGREVMRRVKAERDRFVGFVVEAVESWPREQRVKGTARFVDDNTLELDDGTTIEAERVVIATGSRPKVPPMFEGLGERMVTSDDLFYWDDLPESAAVFGPGVIGLELGQALHRLGVRVTLFGRGNQVGPVTDPEVKATALKIFQDEMEFYPDAKPERLENVGDGVEIEFTADGQTHNQRFEVAVIATGRAPNVDRLGLENTGLELDERGIPKYDVYTRRCGNSSVFIAGDSDANLPLLHEAADEGRAAGYNAGCFPEVRSIAKSSQIGVVFSDPQLMMVGETHRELTARDADFAIGHVDWSDQGRARVMLVNQGLLRVYGERGTGLFLGAEMVGPAAEHLAHLLAWAHQSKLTVQEILERPFYHPCLEEGVRSAFRTLAYNLEMAPKPVPRCLDCGPGG